MEYHEFLEGSHKCVRLCSSLRAKEMLTRFESRTVCSSCDSTVCSERTLMGTFDILYFKHSRLYSCGPDSSVGIATDYGAGRSGIESRLGRDFPSV